MNSQEFYHAALINLLQQTHAFCQASNHARVTAEQHDPQGKLYDSLAEQVMHELVNKLRHQLALNPGLREIFGLALSFERPLT